MPAASAGRRSELAGATIANNSDRVAESGKSSEVAAMTASSWWDVSVATTAGRNSAAEETAVRTRWVVEAKVVSNSQAVAAATDDRIQRAVEARTVHTENVAAETVASNSAAFGGRTVSKESAAVAERLADNW